MKPERFSMPSPTIEVSAKEVQVALMPLAYEEDHEGAHPNMADEAERHQVALEWINTYAGPYREYVESHKEFVDPKDPKALLDLLHRIKEETIH